MAVTQLDDTEVHAPLAKGTIVIADDDSAVAESLAVRLQIEGYDVHTAFNGQDAISIICQRKPDLAIVDIGMPIVDGYEIAQAVRRSPNSHHTLMIAISGWFDSGSVRKAIECGFDGTATKPITHAAIGQLLRDLSTRREAGRL